MCHPAVERSGTRLRFIPPSWMDVKLELVKDQLRRPSHKLICAINRFLVCEVP